MPAAGIDMANRTERKTPQVSIRLTVEERARLEAEAGRRSLSDYIRSRLFGQEARCTATRAQRPDDRLLAQILAKLGQSELVTGLKEISRALQTGVPVTPETERAVHAAARSISEIRTDLLRALGLVEKGEP
jgi:hypothetical protein